MNINKIIKFVSSVFIAFILFFNISENVKAACTVLSSGGPVAPQGETCNTVGTGARGRSEFSCANYSTPTYSGYGCYFNTYDCDTPCGSGGGPPSGGGGSCARPTVNCAPGTTRGTVRQTMYSCATSRPTGCPALGSAQRYETARNSAGNPNYGCGNCYWDENDVFISCDWYRVGVYNCVSTTPTCTVDVLPQTVAAGTTAIVPASIPTSSGTITQVDFTSSDPSVATVTTPDTTASYSTTATAVGAGTTTITANVVMSGNVRCTDSAVLTVTNTSAWWQVRDGDVTAESGDISSSVPAGQLFNTNGLGGFPGVFVYSGSLSAGAGSISSTNWNADTTTTQGRIFDYSYFENLIPDDIIPTTNANLLTSSGYVADGYEWFKITGDLAINAINFNNRKVILFVDSGDLTINGNINITDGTGFFGAFVNGDISVNSTVTGTPSLEGVYLSDGAFSTGIGNLPLQVRGSVTSYGGINLQRNLSNNTNPAEIFEYAPDQILLFPKKLAFRRTKWAEIAP